MRGSLRNKKDTSVGKATLIQRIRPRGTVRGICGALLISVIDGGADLDDVLARGMRRIEKAVLDGASY
jgi:hypothetical protein